MIGGGGGPGNGNEPNVGGGAEEHVGAQAGGEHGCRWRSSSQQRPRGGSESSHKAVCTGRRGRTWCPSRRARHGAGCHSTLNTSDNPPHVHCIARHVHQELPAPLGLWAGPHLQSCARFSALMPMVPVNLSCVAADLEGAHWRRRSIATSGRSLFQAAGMVV